MKFLVPLVLLLVSLTSKVEAEVPDPKSLNCLTEALYFEARGQGEIGQKAVGHVILNRTKSEIFPTSICSVIYQPGQFSFTRKKHKIREWKAWQKSYQIANDLITKVSRDFTNKALYFHRRPVIIKNIKFAYKEQVFY